MWLKVLDYLGLTNLTDDQIAWYCYRRRLARHEDKAINRVQEYKLYYSILESLEDLSRTFPYSTREAELEHLYELLAQYRYYLDSEKLLIINKSRYSNTKKILLKTIKDELASLTNRGKILH